MADLRVEQTATGLNLAAYEGASAVDLTVDGVTPGGATVQPYAYLTLAHPGVSHTTFATTNLTIAEASATGFTITGTSVTITTGGRYKIDTTFGYQANGVGSRVARVTKNGALWGQGRMPALTAAGARTTVAYSRELRFAAGDVIAFLAYHDAGSGVTLTVDSDISSATIRRIGD